MNITKPLTVCLSITPLGCLSYQCLVGSRLVPALDVSLLVRPGLAAAVGLPVRQGGEVKGVLLQGL